MMINTSALRLRSALARSSSVIAAPLAAVAPLPSSACRSLSSSSSSSSSLFSSPSSSSSSPVSSASAFARSPRTFASLHRPIASTASSGLSSSRWIQSRNMASEIPKIKVKNPVVELDGDEVGLVCISARSIEPRSTGRNPAHGRCRPFYSFPPNGLLPSVAHVSWPPLRQRGERRRSLP
ncbi:hypothetical protein P168DRAFT_132313 [Aspergillus campestris IBT 28561]|uniref:Uncharacterized protein n=1 Tax=Aspergillus campestris (strain IBT 28561) TaxID=1392248 RepID=A0A2I1D7U0_ASPC2|nr:uncharacterized protein P168DRAFT_132313 [Aspergillus campestris IBT 28561]PKY05923.1 hypothetical protein P168DRAFT_132313 [Aspergillus campestris IBT 28561]